MTATGWLIASTTLPAQASAAGTAAGPFAGRMIDVQVDEWAKVVIATAAACGLRDAEKQAASKSASA